MSDETQPALAMSWCDDSQRKILREIAPDTLGADYKTWGKNASRALRQMAAAL